MDSSARLRKCRAGVVHLDFLLSLGPAACSRETGMGQQQQIGSQLHSGSVK
jgi:hypothetical protein